MAEVSVVIPLYNKAPYIERTLRSVLVQTFQDFEIIVLDDGSTDNGPEIVKSILDTRIRLIQQKNAGVSAARNRGIKEANADLIAFLDADDEWKPKFLETILRLRKKFPEAGAYATAYKKISPDGRRYNPPFRSIPGPSWEGALPSYFKAAALGTPPVCASAVCIPRSVFYKVGMFAEDKRMGEDLDLWGRIALYYEIAFSSQPCALYHEEILNRAGTAKFGEHDEHPFISTVDSLTQDHQVNDTIKNINLYVERLKLENARQHVINGNYERSRQLLSGTIRPPFLLRKIIWGTRLNKLIHFAWNRKYKN